MLHCTRGNENKFYKHLGKTSKKKTVKRVTLSHTSAEGHLGYEKCLQESVNGFWALLTGYFENQLSRKY